MSAKPSATSPSTAPAWARIGIPALLVVAVAVAFAPGLTGDFVNWDDQTNFTRNLGYRGLSLPNLRWMFTANWGHYIPLTWLTFGVDYLLWGLNPVGYHVTSLALHAVNAVLFYRLLLALLPAGRPYARGLAAGSGGLFFAIHPLRVESVVWITERRDVLAGLFALLAVAAYLNMLKEDVGSRGRRRWYALSLGAFAASLLSKAIGVTLPLALLVLDGYPLGRLATRNEWRRALVDKLPYAALAAAATALAVSAERQAGAFHAAASHTWIDAVMQPGYRVLFHLAKTIVPVRLSPLYLYRPMTNPFEAKYVLGNLALVAVTALLVVGRRRWPGLLAAWLAYGVLIGPFAGLVQIGSHFAADRNTYLACLPWAVLASAGVLRLVPAGRPAGMRWPAAWLAAVALTLGVLTFRQAGIWKNSVALWNHVLALDPTAVVALHNRGHARIDARDADGAVADFTAAIALAPTLAESYNGRGVARKGLGDLDGALRDYDQALRLDSSHAEGFFNRSLIRALKNDPEGVIADTTAGLRLEPNDVGALQARAAAHMDRREYAATIADATAALALAPKSADAYGLRGIARVFNGDRAGRSDLIRALDLAPPGWVRRRGVEALLHDTDRRPDASAK